VNWLAAATLLILPLHVFADDGNSSQPSTDHSAYTLFNPTPSNALRGMQTDRPNVTNAPTTIDPGHVQFETGIVDYSHFDHHVGGVGVHDEDWSIGQINARLGVLDRLELNAVINPYQIDHDRAGAQTTNLGGLGDTVLGGKLNLWGEEMGDKSWASALAIQPQFKIPTARGGTGNGRSEFDAGLPFYMNLPKGFHLGLQTAVFDQRNTADTGYTTGWQNAASVDRTVFANLDVYLEYASEVTTEKHAEAVQTIDVGGVYQISDNLTFDTGLFFGLNRAAANVEVTVGFSLRI
jgi:hypothetical protein